MYSNKWDIGGRPALLRAPIQSDDGPGPLAFAVRPFPCLAQEELGATKADAGRVDFVHKWQRNSILI